MYIQKICNFFLYGSEKQKLKYRKRKSIIPYFESQLHRCLNLWIHYITFIKSFLTNLIPVKTLSSNLTNYNFGAIFFFLRTLRICSCFLTWVDTFLEGPLSQYVTKLYTSTYYPKDEVCGSVVFLVINIFVNTYFIKFD